MSFDISHSTGNYGDGHNGDLTLTQKNTRINEYAKVTAISGKKITLDNVTNANAFSIGTLVMIHVAGYSGSASSFAYSGNWKVSRITAIDGTTITINKNCNGMTENNPYAKFQAITVPEYTSVTIPANTSLTCPQFDKTTGTGGVVAFMCSGDLIFDGGHIDLNGKGLPDDAWRGSFAYESDTKWTGYENYKAKTRLPINYPDGTAFIVAQSMIGHEDSRIGNVNSYGTARTALSVEGKCGGANIFIAAGNISNFNAKMISKTPSIASGGKGWSGCYIATESELPCDEGLYAYDRISNEDRMTEVFKIKNYGTGVNGTPDAKQIVKQLNSYAAISAIDKTRTIFSILQQDNNGIAKIQKGAMVMIRVDRKSSGYYQHVGRFIITEILDIKDTNKVYVKHALPNPGNVTTKHYNFQMVAIPQFADFTLAKTNSATPKYENGRGGIVAIAVNGTCDLSGGKLLVEGKGGCPAGNVKGLNFISNAQMAEKLPIGKGNGSVFILANNLIMDTNTRIGASWTGDGWAGVPDKLAEGYGGGYGPNGTGTAKDGGSGASGGYGSSGDGATFYGGYNSNAYIKYDDGTIEPQAYQGAHILIVANKITGLNVAPLSTGGQGGTASRFSSTYHARGTGTSGGCGFGGGGGYLTKKSGTSASNVKGGMGGYIGGGGGDFYNYSIIFKAGLGNAYCYGGGSGAFCFIYCNKYENQDTAYLFST